MARQAKPPSHAKEPEQKETPGWATAFHRPEAKDNQPTYTGPGLIDLAEFDGELDGPVLANVRVSVWGKRDRNGNPRLRIHIEPEWTGNDDDGDPGPEDKPPGDDNIPF